MIAIEPLFTKSITQGTVYRQFCPMAFDKAGAYWFSDAKEIRNPYFGDRMPTCGTIDKTITKSTKTL